MVHYRSNFKFYAKCLIVLAAFAGAFMALISR